jgi:hypothetical protein
MVAIATLADIVFLVVTLGIDALGTAESVETVDDDVDEGVRGSRAARRSRGRGRRRRQPAFLC